MEKVLVHISEAVTRFSELQFKKPIDWKIKNGEHWAIIGANGSGKSLLVDILLGKYALKSGEIVYINDNGEHTSVSSMVKSVAFKDIYTIIDTRESYYQQRWNKGDEHDVPLVSDLISTTDTVWLQSLVDWFGIQELMTKELNLLSSGELRKFLIVRSLLSKPRILIIDNPFIGLDKGSRNALNELLERLAIMDNLQVVLVLSNPNDIPSMITHILPVKHRMLLHVIDNQDSEEKAVQWQTLFDDSRLNNIKLPEGDHTTKEEFRFAAVLRNIHIRYGTLTILKGLDWQIEQGEKWALLGENGAGKSTLLSLICGDNPQAYANDITLFDRKRGSGESIWDIKRRIGYISPEMHLYYLKNVRCIDVVGSGFFDTVGLYKKCSTEQQKIAIQWMKVFQVDHLCERSFLNISSGEQRLILLARVFVKNPDLLILDEPLHGLDIMNKRRVKKIIENFCDKTKSLIYVTHYEDEIPDVVNKRLVLKKIK